MATELLPPVRRFYLGVNLSDGGAQPAVWRTHGTLAARPFDAERMLHLAWAAHHGGVDFVTFDDSFSLQVPPAGSGGGPLDAALIASRLAPHVPEIGLVAHVDVGYTAPHHVARALATVDHVSQGRVAWQLGWSRPAGSAATAPPGDADPWRIAVTRTAAAIETVRQAWQAERAPGSGTTTAADDGGVRRVAYDGIPFAVREPAAANPPVQPRLPIVVLLPPVDHPALSPAVELAGSAADVVRVRARTVQDAVAVARTVRGAAQAAGRRRDELRILVDAFVLTGPSTEIAETRLALLGGLDESEAQLDAVPVVGTAEHVAWTFQEWSARHGIDGAVVRPASLATDLDALADGVQPLLRSAGLAPEPYPGGTLLETLSAGGPHQARRADPAGVGG